MNARLNKLLFCALTWLGLFSVTTLGATELATAFDAANNLYEQGKFTDAVAAYERLIETGTVSTALYYNLGNAQFKSGQIGRAIAAYRRAEELSPRDPDVRANLQFARDQAQGPSFSPNAWQRWLSKLTLNQWTLLATGSLWLWFILLAALQWRPQGKNS